LATDECRICASAAQNHFWAVRGPGILKRLDQSPQDCAIRSHWNFMFRKDEIELALLDKVAPGSKNAPLVK
jgi:hypothetical protein